MSSMFRWALTLLAIAAFVGGIAWKSLDRDPSVLEPTLTDSTVRSEAAASDQAMLPGDRPLPTHLTPEELANIKLFESAAPSVCYITTSNVRRDFWTQNITEIPRGTGSGFVWDRRGHIVTNYHVLQGADRAQVTLADRSTWDAEIVGIAPEKDLAVLLIDAEPGNLVPIPVGTSEDLRVGQVVFAIGNPFGLDQTLTKGIVSALGREIKSVAGIPIRDVIQTDAAINPGNSGGPLLDSGGELIGVNTAIFSPSGASAGIGFSIPVDVVNWVVPELIEYGELKRPSLSIDLVRAQIVERLLQEGSLDREGALVYGVSPRGAGERAGLRPTSRDRYGRIQLGDLIVQLDDIPIASNNDYFLALEQFEAGDIILITVLRDGKLLELKTQLDPPQ